MEHSLQILSETILTEAEQTAGAPVYLQSLQVAYDYTHNREVLVLTAQNCAPLALRSLYFDLVCTDDAGDCLGTLPGACIRGLNAAPGEVFGSDSPVVIPFAGTCHVTLTLQKAVFADGSVWRVGDPPMTAEAVPSAPADPLPAKEEWAATAAPVAEEATAPADSTPVIPAEWLDPPATVEGYRAAAEGLAALGDAGKPYLIAKFKALADKLEAEAVAEARRAAAAEAAARKEADYQSLLSQKGESADQWEAVAAGWAKLSGYKDATRRAEDAKKKAKALRTSEKRLAAKRAEEVKQAALEKAARRRRTLKITAAISVSLIAVAAIVVLIFAVIIPAGKQSDYEAAEAHLEKGEYTAAIGMFEALGGYKDSAKRAEEIRFTLTGRRDGIFLLSEEYPCYSIENGILTYNSTTYYISSETLKVPDYLDDQKVTTIAANSFSNMSHVTAVILPPSVTSIEDGAFADCENLVSFQGDNLFSIGAEAFRGCTALTEFTLPKNVVTLGNNAFQGCTALRKVTLSSRLEELADGLFLGCTALETVEIPQGVQTIGADTFALCSALKALELPDTISSIGNNAFLNCSSLTSLTIPDRVTAMGNKAMAGCTALLEVRIGSGITTISQSSFENCTALQTVYLPAVTLIGRGAFAGCTALANVHYAGSADAYAKVEILGENAPLHNATLHHD